MKNVMRQDSSQGIFLRTFLLFHGPHATHLDRRYIRRKSSSATLNDVCAPNVTGDARVQRITPAIPCQQSPTLILILPHPLSSTRFALCTDTLWPYHTALPRASSHHSTYRTSSDLSRRLDANDSEYPNTAGAKKFFSSTSAYLMLFYFFPFRGFFGCTCPCGMRA
jgi:hypothetical protein